MDCRASVPAARSLRGIWTVMAAGGPAAERTCNLKRILAVFLVLTLTLCGCAALGEEPEAPAARDTLVVGNATEMTGNFFSEIFGNSTADLDVRTLLHGYNLMVWHSEQGTYSVNPSVVRSLRTQDDAQGNRTYVISLWSDLAYSDGTPITAADFAFSMLLSMAPEMEAIGAQTIYSDYVIGSDGYRAGESKTLPGVRILDETTLSIEVKAGFEPYFYEMGLLNYVPYPIHVIAPECRVADHGSGVTIENVDETVEEPVFTAELLRETMLDPETGYLSHPSVVSGAYVLDSYDAAEHVARFSINPYFKGDAAGRKPTIPKLIYRHVAPEDMVEALESGEVDLLNKCAVADVIKQGLALTEAKPFAASAYPRSGYSFVSFNCERPAMGSDLVRKAIAHCLDKQVLVTSYVGSYGVAVDGYYGMGQWMYALATGAQEPIIAAPAADATDAEKNAYESARAAWKALNLDGVKTYDFDVNEAIRLLESDGWTLNREGEAFDPQRDDARCKEIDGELTALELKLIYPEGNAIGDAWDGAFLEHLAQAGVMATAEARPMSELLDVYYRNVERDCDMIYLATNFATVFDPSYTFSPEEAYQGYSNTTGVMDETLYQRAVDMRMTQPGDALSYCRKWIAFQERWAEVLPSIPVYSNMYYDFYADWLRDYQIASGLTWADAIIGSYIAGTETAPADEAAVTD